MIGTDRKCHEWHPIAGHTRDRVCRICGARAEFGRDGRISAYDATSALQGARGMTVATAVPEPPAPSVEARLAGALLRLFRVEGVIPPCLPDSPTVGQIKSLLSDAGIPEDDDTWPLVGQGWRWISSRRREVWSAEIGPALLSYLERTRNTLPEIRSHVRLLRDPPANVRFLL